MYLAHIFLPAMLIVICRSQQSPSHLSGAYGSDESMNFFGNQPISSDSFASLVTDSSTELLDRYRQLTAKSLLNLRDSCKVHDFLQNLKHNMEVDSGNGRHLANQSEMCFRTPFYCSFFLQMMRNPLINLTTAINSAT